MHDDVMCTTYLLMITHKICEFEGLVILENILMKKCWINDILKIYVP